jgi:heme exporter protein D
MNGIVAGGWAYVWAAYIISALILAGFTARTVAIFRGVARRQR